MAEFCRECFKRCIEPGALDKYIVVSEDKDLCEGCGEFKQVVLEYNPTEVFEEIKTGLKQAIEYERRVNMMLKELIDLLASKDGDELFEKTSEVLKRIGVSMYNEDGSYKDTYTLICEIAEVWNKEK